MRAYREVKRFSAHMLRTLNLDRNRLKGPISPIPLHTIRKKYQEERGEFVDSVDAYYHAGDREARIRRLGELEGEAVDVANVMLFAQVEARRLRVELEAE